MFFALDLALWNTAVMQTGAAVASILGNNTPHLRRHHDVAGAAAAAAARRSGSASSLSLAGCVHDHEREPPSARRRAGSLYGDLLALVASVFFAAYLLTTERVRQSMDTLTFNTLAIAGSIGDAVADLRWRCGLPLTGYPPRAWAALVALGLVSQLAAYYALVYALGHLPATITSVGLLAQVPSTAFLAWLLLGEPLTAVQIAGAAVVLAGIYVVNRQRRIASARRPTAKSRRSRRSQRSRRTRSSL